MAYYLSKYVGKYRLAADIDLNTNDFPRHPETDELEQMDVYIKCQKGSKVYHYGRNKLVCYIPSIGRGHNALKTLAIVFDLYKQEDFQDGFTDYDTLYSTLNKDGRVFDIVENDLEIEWKFDDRNEEVMEQIMLLMKPITTGASISPYSPKNLPKNKSYTIDTAQLEAYKSQVDRLDAVDKLQVHRLTDQFLKTVVALKYKHTDIKKDMKKTMLKAKEYIHYKGLFDEYLKYLEKEIDKIIKTKGSN